MLIPLKILIFFSFWVRFLRSQYLWTKKQSGAVGRRFMYLCSYIWLLYVADFHVFQSVLTLAVVATVSLSCSRTDGVVDYCVP